MAKGIGHPVEGPPEPHIRAGVERAKVQSPIVEELLGGGVPRKEDLEATVQEEAVHPVRPDLCRADGEPGFGGGGGHLGRPGYKIRTLPPTASDASRTMTLRPARFRCRAAERPAAPAPTTTAST